MVLDIIPASCTRVLLFHILQAASRAQLESVSGPDGIVLSCLTVQLVASQVGSARMCSSSFPIHQSSKRISSTRNCRMQQMHHQNQVDHINWNHEEILHL